MQKTKIKHRGTSIGSLRHRVLVHERDIAPADFGSVDFDEEFKGTGDWVGIKTIRGKTVFDGVGEDIVITHEVHIRHRDDITSQTFIQLADGRRMRVVEWEPLDERRDYIVMSCTDRGLDEAAKL